MISMPKNEEVYHRSTIRTDKEWAQRYIYEGDTCNEEFKDICSQKNFQMQK